MLEIKNETVLNKEIPRSAGRFLRGINLIAKKKYNISDRSGQSNFPDFVPAFNRFRMAKAQNLFVPIRLDGKQRLCCALAPSAYTMSGNPGKVKNVINVPAR